MVPPIPVWDRDLVDRHTGVHHVLADAVRGADAPTRRAFTTIQRRIVVEALANVQAVQPGGDVQLVLPPPRAFLTEGLEVRMWGARAAFGHIDSRIAMLEMGAVDEVLDDTAHVALHSMFEGLQPSGKETNAGMLRVGMTSWKPEANTFVHPEPSEVAALVRDALEVARRPDAPACVRAAWLTSVMLSIHPFIDGNGRTSRALYMLVAAPAVPLRIDWGIAEQWSLTRASYIAALQAAQTCERYDAAHMDMGAFVDYSTRASIAGAELAIRRVEVLSEMVTQAREGGLSDDAALLLTVVRVWVNASPDEMARVLPEPAGLDAAITELRSAGAASWAPRPHSRRTILDRAEHGLVALV